MSDFVSAASARAAASSSAAIGGSARTHEGTDSKASHYGKRGTFFMESFRAMGPGAVVARLRTRVGFHSFVYGMCGFGAVYALTTDRVRVSSDDNSPDKYALQHFNVQLLIKRNRLTGRETEVYAAPDAEGKPRTYRVYVNRLLYSYTAYHQLVRQAQIIDVSNVIDPLAFAERQFLRDGRAARRELQQSSSVSSHVTSSPSVSSQASERKAFKVEFTGRPSYHKEIANGSLGQMNETVREVVVQLLSRRYNEWILHTKYAEEAAARPQAVVEHLLRSGGWTGEGVSLRGLITRDGQQTVDDFAKEVLQLARLRQKPENGILNDLTLRLL